LEFVSSIPNSQFQILNFAMHSKHIPHLWMRISRASAWWTRSLRNWFALGAAG